MEYSVYDNKANGEQVLIADGLTEKEASRKAEECAKTRKGITVEWHRRSDGQHGYLNQDGNHDVTGHFWVIA